MAEFYWVAIKCVMRKYIKGISNSQDLDFFVSERCEDEIKGGSL